MPIKFNKNVSAQLFRYVKSVDIKFNRKLDMIGVLIECDVVFP
jgi:hypothetical protein